MNIKDVAALAHVSPATVSKALNNGYGVDPATAARIRGIAEECGYLRQKKKIKQENRKRGQLRVAILCPEIASTDYAGFAARLSACLKERGSSAIYYSYDFDKELRNEILAKCLDDPAVDALFLLSHLEEKMETEIPIFTFGGHPAYSHIKLDRDLIELAVEYLISKGKKELCFAAECMTGNGRTIFERALADRGLRAHSVLVAESRFERAGEQNARALLEMEHLPDGIVCAYDEVAFGLIGTLQAAGVRVPEDVAVVGRNDILTAVYCFGGVTSVSYDREIITRVVEDLLADEQKGTFERRTYTARTYIAERYTG